MNTSSAGIIGKKPDGSPGDEETEPAPIARANKYFQSKLRAEQALNELAGRTGLEVIHILPGLMLGPGDAAPTTAGKLILGFLAGRLPALPPGGSKFVDARDVAAAMAAAAERGRSGARYIVAGRYHTLEAVITLLASVSGTTAPRRKIPYPVSLALAWLSERVARLSGSEPRLSAMGVRTMQANLDASSDRARRELGATFRPLEQTLRDEVAWFQTHGYTSSSTLTAQPTASRS